MHELKRRFLPRKLAIPLAWFLLLPLVLTIKLEVDMKNVGGERIRPLYNTRQLRKQIDSVAKELDDIPEQVDPEEWPEDEQPSSDLEAELLKCKQLRRELRSLKRQRR